MCAPQSPSFGLTANGREQAAARHMTELQPATDLEPATSNRIGDYDKLTDADRALVYHLDQAGKSQTEIAQVIGCNQSCVSRWLSRFKPTTEQAKARAHNRALELTEATLDGVVAAAQAGKPEAGLEMLDRLGVAEKRQTQGAGVVVNVVQGAQLYGLPGQGLG